MTVLCLLFSLLHLCVRINDIGAYTAYVISASELAMVSVA